jgi:hypothetical protein
LTFRVGLNYVLIMLIPSLIAFKLLIIHRYWLVILIFAESEEGLLSSSDSDSLDWDDSTPVLSVLHSNGNIVVFVINYFYKTVLNDKKNE